MHSAVLGERASPFSFAARPQTTQCFEAQRRVGFGILHCDGYTRDVRLLCSWVLARENISRGSESRTSGFFSHPIVGTRPLSLQTRMRGRISANLLEGALE